MTPETQTTSRSRIVERGGAELFVDLAGVRVSQRRLRLIGPGVATVALKPA